MAKKLSKEELADLQEQLKLLKEGKLTLEEMDKLTKKQRDHIWDIKTAQQNINKQSTEELEIIKNRKIERSAELKLQRESLEMAEGATDEGKRSLDVTRQIHELSLEQKDADIEAAKAEATHGSAMLDQQYRMLDAEKAAIEFIEKGAEISDKASEEEVKAHDAKIAAARALLKIEGTSDTAVEEGLAIAKETYDVNNRKHEGDQRAHVITLQNLEAQEESQKAIKGMGDHYSDILSSLTGISDGWKQTGWGRMVVAMKGTEGGAQAMEIMKNAIKDTLKPSNIAAGTFEKIVKETKALAFAQDTSIAGFRRATGAGKEYNDIMIQTEISNRHLGITSEQSAESTEALFRTMADFTKLSSEMKGKLVEATAQMTKLGIAAGAGAELYENVQNSLGMTADAAISTGFELAGLAKGIGVAPQEMAAGFNAAMPQLAAWGDESIKIFKGVAAAAKATGISTQALLGIVGQFDTFSGAAEAAGKLNAVLGGNLLNSVDMLTASEDERIRMMIQSIDVSGRSWKSMNKFEKMAVASAAGISDMSEANKLFGQSLSAYDEMQQKAKESVFTQAELQDQMQGGMDINEKWQQVMKGFALSLRPVVDGLHKLVEGILWLQQTTDGAFGYIAMFTTGLYALVAAQKSSYWLTFKTNVQTMASIALKIKSVTWDKLATLSIWGKIGAQQSENLVDAAGNAIKKKGLIYRAASWVWDKITLPFKALMTAAKWLGFGATVAETSANAASIPVKIASTAATTSAIGPMLAFGVAALMTGIAIAGAAAGMYLLVGSITALFTSGGLTLENVGLFSLLALSIAVFAGIMSTIGWAAVPPLLGLGAAFVMIGAGVLLAGLGLAMFTTAITGLFAAGGLTLESIGLIGLFSASIFILAAAMAYLGTIMMTPIGLAALVGLAGILGVLALTILMITPALMMLSNLFAELGGITATAKIDVEGGQGGALTQTIKAVKEIEELGSLENTKTVAEMAMKLQAAVGPAAATAGGAAGGGFKKKSPEKEGQTIVLKLDNKEFARAVVKALNEDKNMSMAT